RGAHRRWSPLRRRQRRERGVPARPVRRGVSAWRDGRGRRRAGGGGGGGGPEPRAVRAVRRLPPAPARVRRAGRADPPRQPRAPPPYDLAGGAAARVLRPGEPRMSAPEAAAVIAERAPGLRPRL